MIKKTRKKFRRKDNKTNKVLFILLGLLSLGIIYLGLSKLHWLWNLLTLPIGLSFLITSIINYKKTNHEIHEIEFSKNTVNIKYLNEVYKEISNEKISYSILIKKSVKPVKAIEIIENRKTNLIRGKSLRIIKFSKWESEIELIARALIQNEFQRKKWKFSWGFGDFLLIFAILFGGSENLVEGFIGDVGLNVSDAIGEVGTIISDEK